jgi:hypothetical protein
MKGYTLNQNNECFRIFRYQWEIMGFDVQKNMVNQNTVGAYTASVGSSDYCIGTDGKFKKFDLILDIFCAEKVTQ